MSYTQLQRCPVAIRSDYMILPSKRQNPRGLHIHFRPYTEPHVASVTQRAVCVSKMSKSCNTFTDAEDIVDLELILRAASLQFEEVLVHVCVAAVDRFIFMDLAEASVSNDMATREGRRVPFYAQKQLHWCIRS